MNNIKDVRWERVISAFTISLSTFFMLLFFPLLVSSFDFATDSALG